MSKIFLNGFIQVKMLVIIKAEAGKPPFKKNHANMTKKYNRMAQEVTKIIYKKSYITKSTFQLI